MMSASLPSIDLQEVPPGHALNLAALALTREGVVRLQHFCSPGLVDSWRAHFEQFIQPEAAAGRFPYRIWSLGDRRTHYILEIRRQLNSPDFYANPVLYALAKSMLGEGFILATAAIAYAEPGAMPQYIHRDQPLLFPGNRINEAIPAVSLTVSIPLVDTDDTVGGTEFQPGTHRANMDAPFIRADAGKGDCLVWDSRLLHRGRANLGELARPIVLLYYQRPWFFNFPNYSADAEIKITDEALAQVPPEFRHLFDWVRKLWPLP